MRTGSEPATARSALRARFWLSVWGLVWTVFGTVAFALAGRPGWALACGVLWLIVTIDLAVVLRHLRQGPHWQPGRDIPPYRPVQDGPSRPPPDAPHGQGQDGPFPPPPEKPHGQGQERPPGEPP